jgi:hypothetical protein
VRLLVLAPNFPDIFLSQSLPKIDDGEATGKAITSAVTVVTGRRFLDAQAKWNCDGSADLLDETPLHLLLVVIWTPSALLDFLFSVSFGLLKNGSFIFIAASSVALDACTASPPP